MSNNYEKTNLRVEKIEASLIMWFVSEKFRSQNVSFEKNAGEDALTHIVECNLIDEEFLDYFSDNTYWKNKIEKFNKLKENEEDEEDEQDEFKLYKCTPTYFNDLRKFAEFYFLGESVDDDKKFSEVFLDTICYYGQKCSFEKFREKQCLPLKLNSNLKFIYTKMDYEISNPVLDLAELLSYKTSNDSLNTNRILKTIFSEKISKIKEHYLEDGYCSINEEDYPKLLRLFIQESDYGFGVNVPKYDGFWDTDEGKNILTVNRYQWANYNKVTINNINPKLVTKGSYQYQRILFINGIGSNKKKCDSNANKLILETLAKRINVLVIFTHGLNMKQEEIEKLDVCILRIDDYPFIIETKFIETKNKADDKEKIKGRVHFRPKFARTFFDDQLKPILQNKEHIAWIFEAKRIKGEFHPQLIPVSEGHILAIITSLETVFKSESL